MVPPPAPDPAQRFVAARQLQLPVLERGARLLGDRWPAALAGLELAGATTDVVLVGPIASCLRGHPGPLPDLRVGLIGRWRHQGGVLAQLMDAGAMMHGFDTAPDGFASRERWTSSGGATVSVGWLLADRDDEIAELEATGETVDLPGGGQLVLPSAAALRARAGRSPWPQDRELVPGFDAVLAASVPAPERPAGQIVLQLEAVGDDRSRRAQHVVLTVPFAGELPRGMARRIAAALRLLVLREGDPRTLRGITVAEKNGSLSIEAAGTLEQVDDWLGSGDLLAAVQQAVDDAYQQTIRAHRP